MKKIGKVLAMLVVVIMLVVLLLGYGFAYFSYTAKQPNPNKFKASCYNITYGENNEGVHIENAYPIQDNDGLKQNPYTITLTNNCDIALSYFVYMEILNTSLMNEDYVRIAYNDEINDLRSYSTSTGHVNGSHHSYLLKESTLAQGASVTINIRNWIKSSVTDDYAEDDFFENKIFVDMQTDVKSKMLATAILNANTIHQDVPTTEQFDLGEPRVDGENGSGSGLFVALDNDGTSYYLRGSINNNYVLFAGKLWRVVRINGDGSIRLIFNGITGSSILCTTSERYDRKYFGYTYDNSKICTNASPCDGTEGTSGNLKSYLDNWYSDNLTDYDSQISQSKYCNDTTYTGSAYQARNRIYTTHTPSLVCPDTSVNYGGIYKLKIGLLTADELNMAGYRGNKQTGSASNYLYNTNGFWTGSPATVIGNEIFPFYGVSGRIDGSYAYSAQAFRPVINLVSNIKYTSGNGTNARPYVIAVE